MTGVERRPKRTLSITRGGPPVRELVVCDSAALARRGLGLHRRDPHARAATLASPLAARARGRPLCSGLDKPCFRAVGWRAPGAPISIDLATSGGGLDPDSARSRPSSRCRASRRRGSWDPGELRSSLEGLRQTVAAAPARCRGANRKEAAKSGTSHIPPRLSQIRRADHQRRIDRRRSLHVGGQYLPIMPSPR